MPQGRESVNLATALLIALPLILIACSSSKPSESDGRAFLEHVGKQQGLFKVKSFTKTNGLDQENMYMLEYEAEVECLKVNHRPGEIVFRSRQVSRLL